MSVKEQDTEQIYEQIKETEKQPETLSRMPTDFKSILIFAIAILVIGAWTEFITWKTAIIVGLCTLGGVKLLFDTNVLTQELTEQQLAVNLYKKLRYKQTHPLGNYFQIEPSIQIQIQKRSRRLLINGVPKERIFGVSFFEPQTTKTEYWRYNLDIYTGDITGARELKYGFADLEDYDIKVIESEKIKDEKRYNKALGIAPKRG